jgi:hypothetical protein
MQAGFPAQSRSSLSRLTLSPSPLPNPRRTLVLSADRVFGQSVTNRVSEQFVLQTENGIWRIDQVSRLD